MSNMVNIGTKENPIIVPEHALHPKTPEGREYFQMIAEGSIELPEKGLDVLLNKINNENQ